MRLTGLSRLGVYAVAIAFLSSGLLPRSLAAQGTGGVSGAVTRSDDQSPLGGVIVLVKGTTIRTVTNTSGRYTLERIPAGAQTIEFRWVG